MGNANWLIPFLKQLIQLMLGREYLVISQDLTSYQLNSQGRPTYIFDGRITSTIGGCDIGKIWKFVMMVYC
jgi:hypothetical protein